MTREQLLNELNQMRRQMELFDSCSQDMQVVQARYEKLLESAPDAMLFVNRDTRIVLVNAQFENLFGYGEAELVGKDLHSLIPQRYHERHRHNVAHYLSNPQARPMGTNLEIYGLKKDGTEFPADISLSPLMTDGELLIIASIRDITERKRAELQIERNFLLQTAISAVLKASLEPIPLDEQLNRALDLILAVPGLFPEASGSIYLVEDEAEVLVLSALRKSSSSQVAPCERIAFGQCICGKAASNCSMAFTECLDARHEIRSSDSAPHGHYCVPIVSSAQTLGLINVIIKEGEERTQEKEMFLVAVANALAAVIVRHQAETEKNKFRERLAETEKVAALGRIAANVADEIRNPLTAIGGFARRLEKQIVEDSKEKGYAAFIVKEVTRLERILRNVLSLTRGAGLRLEECDLPGIVAEAVAIFEKAFQDRSITLERSFAATPHIKGERDRILEAIENLISNAIEAMADGGKLTITSGKEVIDGVQYAAVKLSDTGEGIEEGNMTKIFEPFFTTRISSKGVGLGLPIAKKVVEDHGGMIKAESRVGEGSIFVMYFPVALRNPVDRRLKAS